MDEKVISLLRKIRPQIVDICKKVLLHSWAEVNKCWMALETDIYQVVCLKVVRYKILDECNSCIASKNYLRFYDLLFYEIDSDIAFSLSHISKKDRELMSKAAKRKNEEMLGKYHRKILLWVQAVSNTMRIECSYTGTENVSIFIQEKEHRYKLFSSVNPWLESVNLLGSLKPDMANEICVLGFGGGHLVGQLIKIYPWAKIKVFLPCIDLFKKVIDHIPIYEILQNSNLELCYDPTCLNFFMYVQDRTQENAFYINKTELRACVGSVNEIETLIGTNTNKKANNIEEVGRKIENYILNL